MYDYMRYEGMYSAGLTVPSIPGYTYHGYGRYECDDDPCRTDIYVERDADGRLHFSRSL